MIPIKRATGPAAAFTMLVAMYASASASLAQSQNNLRQLEKLHDRIVDPRSVLSANEGRQARDRLAEWKLNPDELGDEDRGRLGRVMVYVALSQGDVKSALEHAKQILAKLPESEQSIEAQYLAAVAAGDAEFGEDVLKQLGRGAKGDERKRISQQKRWIREVGEKAPSVTIRTDDMTEYDTSRRLNKVLVIDFWNVRRAPSAEEATALCELFESYRSNLSVEFVGVNADSDDNVAEARKFAEENGYSWNQRYEHTAIGAPITHEAFRAGSPPWMVLIDTYGYIRAIGAANEPGFHYALRAAAAEADGEQETVMPRTRDGQQATKPGDAASTASERGEKKKDADDNKPLPHSAEAKRLLDEAHLYLKVQDREKCKAVLKKIIREYPGTEEAREAQDWLDDL